MSFWMEMKFEGMLFIFVCMGAWAMFMTIDMLDKLFRSAVGKRKRQRYLLKCTRLERLSRAYIFKITKYRCGISYYLLGNEMLMYVSIVVMISLVALWKCGFASLEEPIRICAAAVLVGAFFPPIILSFALTRYRGGHPCYEFDLDTDFVSRKDQSTKKKLLQNARKSLLRTPEEFAVRKLR